MEKKIVIVGGGFAGISAALELARINLPDTKVILISDKPHFEFNPELYRALTGHSPLEVCIPLADIFKSKQIEVIKDTISKIDVDKNEIIGLENTSYQYDYLILAVGSEVNYFGTQGLKENSYNINSINNTLLLKRHLHESFSQCQNLTKEEKKCNTHIVIVGGGPSGCEVAGELAIYTKKLAHKHNVDFSMVKIDLIHSGPRLLESLPENVSEVVTKRLKDLGVNLILNKRVLKSEVETIYLPDVEMKTKTLIWTAGVKPNGLYEGIKQFVYDEKHRVKVDEYMKAYENIYVVGDGASVKYGGMARPAISQAVTAVSAIANQISKSPLVKYTEKPQKFIIPVGPGWAATNGLGPMMYGKLGWLIKRVRDMRYFLSILPFNKAFTAFEEDGRLTESCEICAEK